MKDRKIVLATHGNMALGLLSALDIIVGDYDIQSICCYTSPDFDLDREVENALSQVNYDTTEVYVFTDITGGSVNSGFVRALSKYDFHLFSNVNLAFLVNFLLSEPDLDECREEAQGETFKVTYCNDALVLNTDGDDL